MQIAKLHPWRVSVRQAIAIQESLRVQVRLQPLSGPVRLVAAADVAYSRATHRMHAAVVVLRLPDFELVETPTASRLARFPYIPGLFSFRELPPLLAAFRSMRTKPDLLLFDGQGLAHPRRFGLACHAGLLLGMPSVGCAKSLLVGEHGPLAGARGSRADLVFGGRVVGAAVRTRDHTSPVIVSPGHLVDLDSAIEVVLATATRFRLPEPLRLAHHATTGLIRRVDLRLRPPRVRGYSDLLKGDQLS
jgi:deoxyribonuclease V